MPTPPDGLNYRRPGNAAALQLVECVDWRELSGLAGELRDLGWGARLTTAAPSMGLMLESAAGRLCEPGGPHYGSPDKRPERRLETRATGRAGIDTGGEAHHELCLIASQSPS